MTLIEYAIAEKTLHLSVPSGLANVIKEVLHEIDESWENLHQATMRNDEISEAYERGRVGALSTLLGDRTRLPSLGL